jgi:hypothetical protein
MVKGGGVNISKKQAPDLERGTALQARGGQGVLTYQVKNRTKYILGVVSVD